MDRLGVIIVLCEIEGICNIVCLHGAHKGIKTVPFESREVIAGRPLVRRSQSNVHLEKKVQT